MLMFSTLYRPEPNPNDGIKRIIMLYKTRIIANTRTGEGLKMPAAREECWVTGDTWSPDTDGRDQDNTRSPAVGRISSGDQTDLRGHHSISRGEGWSIFAINFLRPIFHEIIVWRTCYEYIFNGPHNFFCLASLCIIKWRLILFSLASLVPLKTTSIVSLVLNTTLWTEKINFKKVI